MSIFSSWKDEHSFARNLFILFFCIWMFIIGTIIGYSLNSSVKDQMVLSECIKDELCYLFYNQKNTLSKNEYIIWLIEIKDEHKVKSLKR